jgi:trigger factor
MQVSVENISNIERKLTIIVPAEEVTKEREAQIQKLAKTADIRGFRPGKVPVNVIEQRFGMQAAQEAISSVIQRTLYSAIAEQKLMPVSTPRVEPKMMLANQPLEFTATFEVLPEIGDIKCPLDKLEQLKVDIKDEDIDRVISQLTKQYTQWKPVTRPLQLTDRAVLDYYMVYEGKSEDNNKIEKFPLELGSKVMLPGFEEGLVGKSAGDEVTLKLAFPADFHVEEKRNKPVEFVVSVKQVFEAEAPELNTNFIKRLGIASGNLEDMKTQVRQSLELERDRLVKENLKEQVFKTLIDSNQIDVPKSLVDREAAIIHDELHPRAAHDHDHHHTDEENAMFTDIAKKRVSLGLLIAEYAKKADIKVDPVRVDKRIMEIASAYESPKEVVEYLSAKERRGGIEAQVLEDIVLDKLMEKTQIVEKVMSYAELKGIRV